jgi:DNA ligase-associated metallophosphoesterase
MTAITETRIELAGEELWLSPLRALWYPAEKTLFLADPHLGKAAHFRKNGIPAPQGADRLLIERLEELRAHFEPDRVIVLGDLVHSTRNKEWDRFLEWRSANPSLSFELVPGNHDILSDGLYEEADVRLLSPGHKEGPFRLHHYPNSSLEDGAYALAGHLHPGCRIGRRKKERMTLPCFCFGPRGGILPAFNPFAGMARVEASPEERVFLVGEREVLPLEQKVRKE